MDQTTSSISIKSADRLRAQGFVTCTLGELSQHRAGIRFAYQLCASLLLLGLIFKSIPLLGFLMLMALIATFYDRHPFDYIYDFGIRKFINKPKVPKRAIQGKVACGLATITLAVVIYFFMIGATTGAYIAGGMMLSSATLVSTTDICIPSIIYNTFSKA